MKVEFNESFVSKVKKQLAEENEEIKRRKGFRKKRLNRSYFLLLGFMVLLLGANLTRNIDSGKVDEKTAPVISKSENVEKAEIEKNTPKRENKKIDILNEFTLPISKNKLLSYNFANGVLNIQVDKNEDIKSMTDGVVENIYLDYSYGHTVVIKYNENIICKYSNLDSNIPVKINDEVKKGQIIGKTLDYSLLDSSYLYISVFSGTENVNIVELFDNIKMY